MIVEPIAANMGVVPPDEAFLPGLRSLCDEHGSLLVRGLGLRDLALKTVEGNFETSKT